MKFRSNSAHEQSEKRGGSDAMRADGMAHAVPAAAASSPMPDTDRMAQYNGRSSGAPSPTPDAAAQDGPELGNVGNADQSLLMSHRDDPEYLSEALCFVRSQLEFFVSSDDTVYNVNKGPTQGGRVGIRCKYCANVQCAQGEKPQSKPEKQTRYATSFPNSIRLVYQTVRNFQRFHILKCPAIPEDVKAQYQTLKSTKRPKEHSSGRRRSSLSSPLYWENDCRRRGMIDTKSGIRLQSGRFLSNDRKLSESGKECEESVNLHADSTHCDELTQVLSCARSIPPDMADISSSLLDQNQKIHEEGKLKSMKSQLISVSDEQPQLLPAAEDSPPIIAGMSPTLQLNQPAEVAVSSDTLSDYQTALLASAEETNLHDQGNERTWGLSLTDGDLLEKVSLARNMALAVGQIEQLPQIPLGACDNFCNGNASLQEDNADMLYSLGTELFELFSGLSVDSFDILPTDYEEFECDANGEKPQRRAKREKRREESRHVPLSELGFPPPLCSLVSSLLIQRSNNQKGSEISLAEVEEDLRLMVTEPEKFLFQHDLGGLEISFGPSLYGREEETSTLLGACERSTDVNRNGSELVLVSGYSGTGKSCLVTECLADKAHCFVSGKFDEMKQFRPLSAIISALDDYCGFLARDTDRLENVKQAVMDAIGDEGQFLANLIPNLRKIVDLGMNQSVQNRGREALQHLFWKLRMLLRSTCDHSHPVVIFLDDIHWADNVSLDLMQALAVDSEIKGLILICSYRDNEVGTGHPLITHLEDIKRSHVSITQIEVRNLDMGSITSLISDLLSLTPRLTRPLAEVVFQKTCGNAFFTVQFLTTLFQEGLLHFSLESRRWEWKLNQIRERDIADSVVELMTDKLCRLPPAVQEALCTAAAFGAQCNEAVFQILDRDQSNNFVASLDIAVAEGLLVKPESVYRFPHDQVQHAAYLLIPELGRDYQAFHLAVGRSLMKHLSDHELDLYLFIVVDQYNRGSNLIAHDKERIDLAALSLKAGQRAFSMSSFLPAAQFLNLGLGLLIDDDWERHRVLCFDLFNLCSETEYTLGDLDGSERHIGEALRRAKTLDEKLQPFMTLVQTLGLQRDRVNDAIDTALEVLDMLGESLPEIVSEAMTKEEIMTTQELLAMKPEEELFAAKDSMPEMKKRAIGFLKNLLYLVYVKRKELFPIVACRMVRLLLLHGICLESSLGFVSFGVVLCGSGDFDGGYRLGRIALLVTEMFDAKDYHSRVYAIAYSLVVPWREPIQAAHIGLKRAIEFGVKTGDTEYAMISASMYCVSALHFSGQELNSLIIEMDKYAKQMKEYKHQFIHDVTTPARQVALYLMGRSTYPTEIRDEIHDSWEQIDTIHRYMLRFYFMWLEFLFERYESAWEAYQKNQDLPKHFFGKFEALCNHTFYSGLTALVLARNNGNERAEYAECIDDSIAQIKKWTSSSQWNCEHKLELLVAEHSYLEGNFVDAVRAYDAAIDLAAKHSFVHEQALALEKKAIFCNETGDHINACEHFKRACDCYAKWGASTKVAFIQANYL
eukprot:CAMPEP_0197460062 /NCGR_PEP_ID=MMETSP1175-20131217/53159_1 /TAXON_ID=1003142 /ORGANISM="Triceratium dubium, Strain CCMP147" /LENGTH=1524 /DNA_ID=CAMNT_0042995087 /DNA_START=1 /DNA_END=4575 /DNA_ORIENTATION=+